MNHDVFFGDDREKFVTIKEDIFEFDLTVLQLRNKIALSSRCPPKLLLFLFIVTLDTTLQDCVALTSIFGEFVFGRFRLIFQVMAHNRLWSSSSPGLLYMVCRHAS